MKRHFPSVTATPSTGSPVYFQNFTLLYGQSVLHRYRLSAMYCRKLSMSIFSASLPYSASRAAASSDSPSAACLHSEIHSAIAACAVGVSSVS
mgnify:FL=1